jgi:fucose permease
VMGLALGAVPHTNTLTGLTVVFVVIGLGAAVVDLGANTMLIWHRGKDVGRAMNLLHLCFGLGALSSPLLVQLGVGVAATTGAVAAFLIAGWALFVPPPVAPVVKRDEQTDATPRLLALAAMFFVLYVGLEVGFGGWIHTYGEEIDFSDAGAAWLTALFWISFTTGRLLAAWLAHRLVPSTLLAGACTLALASALVLWLGDGSPAVVWPATALFGLAVAPQFPVMFTYLERRINVTGSATSWFVCGAGLGGLVFPWLIGQWFGRSGAGAMPLATTLLAVATLAWFVMLNRTFAARSKSQ